VKESTGSSHTVSDFVDISWAGASDEQLDQVVPGILVASSNPSCAELAN
jgi:hypothetical protein